MFVLLVALLQYPGIILVLTYSYYFLVFFPFFFGIFFGTYSQDPNTLQQHPWLRLAMGISTFCVPGYTPLYGEPDRADMMIKAGHYLVSSTVHRPQKKQKKPTNRQINNGNLTHQWLHTTCTCHTRAIINLRARDCCHSRRETGRAQRGGEYAAGRLFSFRLLWSRT